MKRYLYILLAAVVAFTACDTEVAISREHIVFFSDKVTTETTENSATITTNKPYIMSGLQEESVVVYMEYWVEGYTTKQKVETYTERLASQRRFDEIIQKHKKEI